MGCPIDLLLQWLRIVKVRATSETDGEEARHTSISGVWVVVAGTNSLLFMLRQQNTGESNKEKFSTSSSVTKRMEVVGRQSNAIISLPRRLARIANWAVHAGKNCPRYGGQLFSLAFAVRIQHATTFPAAPTPPCVFRWFAARIYRVPLSSAAAFACALTERPLHSQEDRQQTKEACGSGYSE
jgi:hypothetical protein